MKKNFASLAYLQNYRWLNIITPAILTNPNPHFLAYLAANFSNLLPHTRHARLYTYVDNFVDQKNNRILLLCFILELWCAENATSAWLRHCLETVFPR